MQHRANAQQADGGAQEVPHRKRQPEARDQPRSEIESCSQLVELNNQAAIPFSHCMLNVPEAREFRVVRGPNRASGGTMAVPLSRDEDFARRRSGPDPDPRTAPR